MVMEAYSPLGTGRILQLEEMRYFAEKYNHSIAQICIRWSLQMGFIPLPKSINASRIRENINVFDFKLSDEDVSTIASIQAGSVARDPRELPLYFRSTDEMLEEFSYLGADVAHEIVVENPNLIADMCETLRPVPHNLFAPSIENSVEDLKSLVYGKMHRLYGENPPKLVVDRVETELHDIISCHYDVIYMSAQKLVQNSLEHGYLVGSRGSVGSSIVAYMSGITEVNSFPPHYRCPKCKFCTFDVPKDAACGADLPRKPASTAARKPY